jgi:hypothetical protein
MDHRFDDVDLALCASRLAGDPVGKYPAGHDIGKYTIERVRDGVGLAIHRKEDLNGERQGEK